MLPQSLVLLKKLSAQWKLPLRKFQPHHKKRNETERGHNVNKSKITCILSFTERTKRRKKVKYNDSKRLLPADKDNATVVIDAV